MHFLGGCAKNLIFVARKRFRKTAVKQVLAWLNQSTLSSVSIDFIGFMCFFGCVF